MRIRDCSIPAKVEILTHYSFGVFLFLLFLLGVKTLVMLVSLFIIDMDLLNVPLATLFVIAIVVLVILPDLMAQQCFAFLTLGERDVIGKDLVENRGYLALIGLHWQLYVTTEAGVGRCDFTEVMDGIPDVELVDGHDFLADLHI